MTDLKELLQSADWQAEKHVPVIQSPGIVKKGEYFDVKVIVGLHIAHPNKTEHHIRWIDTYFMPDGEKFPYQIGRMEFCSHGESVKGPDTSSIYTNHVFCLSLKTDKSGTIIATSLCNIHGLWQNSISVAVQ